MMSLTHEQAQQLIDVGREQLARAERDALHDHLMVCAPCRSYNHESAMLQDQVAHVLRARWEAARPPDDFSLRLKLRLTARSRAQRITRATTSLVYTVAFALIAMVAIWALNAANRSAPTTQPPNVPLAAIRTTGSLTHTIGTLSLPVYIGDRIRLMGFELANDQLVPGSAIDLTLRWQTQFTMTAGYIVFMHVVDSKGNVVAQLDAPPTDGARPTQSWQPGEIIIDRHTLMLPVTATPGQYELLIGLYDSFGGRRERTSLGGDAIRVATLQVSAIPHRLDVLLEKIAALLGYALETTDNKPGSYVAVTLYWQARDSTTKSYQSFVYLTRVDDANAAPIAVSDAVPGNGSRPTPTWNWGETVPDRHLLQLPLDLRPGMYNLMAGLYDSETGSRINTFGGDRLIALTQLEVK